MLPYLLRPTLIAAALLVIGISAAGAEVVFDGVAAGDASTSDAILWTRAENGGNTTDLTVQIATDPGFSGIVTTLAGSTNAASDFNTRLTMSCDRPESRSWSRKALSIGTVRRESLVDPMNGMMCSLRCAR